MVFVALVLGAAAGSAFLAARLASHRHEAEHSHSEASEKDFHAYLHANLKPTPEQTAVLEPLEAEYEKERLRLRGEIDKASRELAERIKAGTRGAPEVEGALARLHGLQGELQRKTLDHFFEMKEHLDASQAALLLKLTHDSILDKHDH